MSLADNGIQFRSKQRSIKHVPTALHSSQTTASEQINRSLIAAIQVYISPDQHDRHDICCALKLSVYSATEHTLYFFNFDQNMITHSESHSPLRQLNLLQEPSSIISDDERAELLNRRYKKNY